MFPGSNTIQSSDVQDGQATHENASMRREFDEDKWNGANRLNHILAIGLQRDYVGLDELSPCTKTQVAKRVLLSIDPGTGTSN